MERLESWSGSRNCPGYRSFCLYSTLIIPKTKYKITFQKPVFSKHFRTIEKVLPFNYFGKWSLGSTPVLPNGIPSYKGRILQVLVPNFLGMIKVLGKVAKRILFTCSVLLYVFTVLFLGKDVRETDHPRCLVWKGGVRCHVKLDMAHWMDKLSSIYSVPFFFFLPKLEFVWWPSLEDGSTEWLCCKYLQTGNPITAMNWNYEKRFSNFPKAWQFLNEIFLHEEW